VAIYDPLRKRNARGQQRQQELLEAASRVFARDGYHEATTNAIAAEAGVSPATLYQFFPNKEALANSLATRLAREMADATRALDAPGSLPFEQAVTRLLENALRFHREHPEFHILLLEAPLQPGTREEKEALSEVFVGFVARRLRQEQTDLGAEATHHGEVALTIFKGILAEVAQSKAAAQARWKRAMVDAVLRYLAPVAAGKTEAAPPKRSR